MLTIFITMFRKLLVLILFGFRMNSEEKPEPSAKPVDQTDGTARTFNWVQGKCLPSTSNQKSKTPKKSKRTTKKKPKVDKKTIPKIKKTNKHHKIPVDERDKEGLKKVLEYLNSPNRSVKNNKRLLKLLQHHKVESSDSDSEIITAELKVLKDLAKQKEDTDADASSSSSYSNEYYYTDTYEYYHTKEEFQDIQNRLHSTRLSTCNEADNTS